MQKFGDFIKRKRAALQKGDKSFSQRQLSKRIGIESSYLSKIERGVPTSLSEEKILLLAKELDIDPDYLLALGGKISSDVQSIIKDRPSLFAQLVREMKGMPDEAIATKSEFKTILSALDQLQHIASIGAFQFSESDQTSFWTGQVPNILGIAAGTPSMEAFLAPFAPETRMEITTAEASINKQGEHLRFELELPSTHGGAKHILLWVAYDKEVGTDELIRVGIIQDVTEIVMLRNEIQDAQKSLQKQFMGQAEKISTGIERLNAEIQRRSALEDELRALNKEMSNQAEIQNHYFAGHAYQLRSLMVRLLMDQGDHQTDTSSNSSALLRILSKIDDLGDFMAQHDNLPCEEKEVDIHKTIRGVLAAFESDLTHSALELKYSQSPDFPQHVIADKRRIEQTLTAVLELMVTNTPWGVIQMASTIREEASALLSFSFFAPSCRNPVAEQDFFPDPPLSSKSMLPINPVQMVGPQIAALGGSMEIQGGIDSEVSIKINIPSQVPAPFPGPQTRNKQTAGSPKRILVVEDDPYNRLFIEKTLSKRGFHVESATCGKEAKQLLETVEFDLLLSDIQLADIDGVSLLQSIKGNSESPNNKTPGIAITALATQSDKKRFLKAGFAEVITKPFKVEVLMAAIDGMPI